MSGDDDERNEFLFISKTGVSFLVNNRFLRICIRSLHYWSVPQFINFFAPTICIEDSFPRSTLFIYYISFSRITTTGSLPSVSRQQKALSRVWSFGRWILSFVHPPVVHRITAQSLLLAFFISSLGGGNGNGRSGTIF